MANSNNTAALALAVVVSLAVGGIGGYMLGNRMNQPEAKVVASVNGEKITEPELYGQLVKNDGATVLDRMITSKLVAQEAKKNSVSVTDAEIAAEMDKIKASLGGEDAYQQALAQNGITEESLKESVLIQLQATKILGKDIKTEEADLKAYFDANMDKFDKRQVTARHILVNTQEEAAAIKAQLDGGADFTTLAKEKSTEPAAKESGGDLGTFGRGRMVAEFEKAAFAMQKGQISDPIQTSYGWHVIQVTDITGDAPDYEKMKEEVKAALVDSQVQAQFSDWLANLRDQAKIDNTLE